jgi:hypothetical protein
MTDKKTRGNGRLVLFIAVATLFIFTNPSEKMHLDFVRESIRNEVEKNSSPLGGSLINLFEVVVGEATINSYLNNYFKRKNYIFFSLTEIQVKGEWKIMAIGVLGNIILWDDMKKSFDRIKNKYDL